jgi:putative inorganic carbon (hco3(-)) transporter
VRIIEYTNKYLLVALGLSVTLVLLIPYLHYLTLGMILISGLILIKNVRATIFILLTALLTMAGEINPSLRIIVQIASILTLIGLVISEYGLNFSKYPALPKQLSLFFLVLFLIMLSSSILSGYFFLGLNQLVKTYVVFFVIYLFFLVLNSEKRIYTALWALLVSSHIIAISMIYAFIEGNYNLLTIFAISNLRVGGILSNINAASVFFAISIPILIGSYFLYHKKREKLFIAFSILLQFIGLILTGSRASFMVIVISMIFVLFFLKRKILVNIISTIIFLILIYLFVPIINESITTLLRLDEGLSQREYLWEITVEMIKDNFIFGIGPGTYGIKMINYFPVLLDSYKGSTIIELSKIAHGANISHNYYLNFFSDLGILGLLNSLILPFSFITIGFRAINKFRPISREYFIKSVVLTGIGIGMFIRGFFEGINIVSFGWITADLPFWLIFIYLIYLDNINNITMQKLNNDS